MRGLTHQNGRNKFVDLPVEFEAGRAFVVVDAISLGAYELKVRVELDPKRLEKVSGQGWDFAYQGELRLPDPSRN